jgi:hypothetical protein
MISNRLTPKPLVLLHLQMRKTKYQMKQKNYREMVKKNPDPLNRSMEEKQTRQQIRKRLFRMNRMKAPKNKRINYH